MKKKKKEDKLNKCVVERGKCVTKPRLCSDLKSDENKYDCTQLNTTDKSKSCIYWNNQCIELYKKCEDYKNDVKKDICEAIQPYNDYSKSSPDYTIRCKFIDGKCTTINKYCSEFVSGQVNKYNEESMCKKLIATDSKKKCFFINNECIEVYKTCENYNENPKKEVCESIENSEYTKCVFENNLCKTKDKICSDYQAEKHNYNNCEFLSPTNIDKKCSLVNGNCIEQYRNCEDYKDDVQSNICESIIPYSEKDKCVFEDGNCVTKERVCSDFKSGESSYTCEKLSSSDPSKKCKFKNNQCIEYYYDCEKYTENVQKDICESIEPLLYPFIQCTYENNKCIYKSIICSDIYTDPKINLKLGEFCNELGIYANKNCYYSDGFCLEKKCLDFTNDANEQICKGAATSDNSKVCSLKKGTSQCEEIDKNGGITLRKLSNINLVIILYLLYFFLNIKYIFEKTIKK